MAHNESSDHELYCNEPFETKMCDVDFKQGISVYEVKLRGRTHYGGQRAVF